MPRGVYKRKPKEVDPIFLNKIMVLALGTELELQGHILTGELRDTIKVITERVGLDYVFSVLMDGYGQIVNEGLEANRVSWKMLPKVALYFEQRGFSEEQAIRIAAATIRQWMNDGMPTDASLDYSRTGKRLHFIETAFNKWDGDIGEAVATAFTYNVNLYFEDLFKSETY